MLLSSCPRCHDSIRIPPSAQSQSVVRCPRCREEFPLNEILDQLPPEAEIVSGPGSQEHTVIPTNLADATEYVLAGEEAKPAVPDFRFKETGSLRPDTPPMAKIDSSRPPRRPKRPEPNIALEFVKVVVGGIVGLGLAVMAIMWFMHQDPLGIVDNLPVQAYMIFPEKKRTDEMNTLGNISLLAEYIKMAAVVMVTNWGIFTPIHATTEFKSFKGEAVSLFSIDRAEISTRDLKYPLDRRVLTNWWQGSLNVSLGETFTVETTGRVSVFQAYK